MTTEAFPHQAEVVRLLDATYDLFRALTSDVDVREPGYEEAMVPVLEFMELQRQIIDFSARMAGLGVVIDELREAVNGRPI